METLCKIREINRAVAAYEAEMEKTYHLCLNEGMLLCSLSKTDKLSSGEIAEALGLSTSNTSKVIKSVENKNLIKRVIGNTDKRQMYFSLTPKGKKELSLINCDNLELPNLLKEILNKNET
jgi:DNA-binding MarR family transcriptional regulator